MQVAAYARVSSRRQAQAQTIEQQLDRLRAHAAARGWGLAQEHVFRDDGHSGASLRRPGLDRRHAAAGARLDRILITAPDRLARHYVHLLLDDAPGGVCGLMRVEPSFAEAQPGPAMLSGLDPFA
jgi:site-specific DNA recombinase